MRYGVRCQQCCNIVPPLSNDPGKTFAKAPIHLAQKALNGLAGEVSDNETPCSGSGQLGRIEEFIFLDSTHLLN